MKSPYLAFDGIADEHLKMAEKYFKEEDMPAVRLAARKFYFKCYNVYIHQPAKALDRPINKPFLRRPNLDIDNYENRLELTVVYTDQFFAVLHGLGRAHHGHYVPLWKEIEARAFRNVIIDKSKRGDPDAIAISDKWRIDHKMAVEEALRKEALRNLALRLRP